MTARPLPPGQNDRSVAAFYTVIGAGACGALLAALSALIPAAGAFYGGLAAIFVVVTVLLAWLARTGRPRLFVTFSLGTGSLLVAFAATTTGGASSPGYASYTFVLIAMSSLLLGVRWSVLWAAGVIVGGGLLLWVENLGMLPQPLVLHTSVTRWLSTSAALTLFVVMQHLATRMTREALERAETEIADRQQAEDQARASEREYREVVSTTPGAVYRFQIDPDGHRHFTFVSAGVQGIFGVTPEEVIADAETLFGMVQPEIRPALEQSIAQVYHDVAPWIFEGPIIARNGTPKWVRGHALPMKLENGAVRWHGVLSDQTDRMLVDQERRESAAKLAHSVSLLQAALESTADGILIVDGKGRVTGYNQKFLSLWRIPPSLAAQEDDELLLGRAASQLKDPAAFSTRVQELYTNPAAASFDVLEFADGRRFERYSQPQIVDGLPVGRVWSFRDVTARTQDEAQRHALEQQLLQAQKMDALGRLAGGIAHDFNNALSAIIGYTELAIGEIQDRANVIELLEGSRTAAGRATDLVKQILAFSRPRTPQRTPVRLRGTVEEASRFLRSTLPARIEIHTSYDADPTILGDVTQLQQVLTNLGVNAEHAMRATGGTLIFAIDETTVPTTDAAARNITAGRYARLRVSDSGHGMNEQTRQRVFEPFFTTKPPTEGTGLGLAVVHGIVRSHGGDISVRSTPGTGTSFELLFPLSPAEAVTPPPSPVPAVDTGGHHIMVVDDEEAIVRLVTISLRRLGYHVTGFSNPETAWRSFAESPDTFSLVLTDLTMPGLTGLELASRVLALRPSKPVLLITGFSDEWTPERVRGVGIRDLLYKPVAQAQLAEVVHRVLSE